MTPVALMVGSNRVITGTGIIHPTGNINLDPDAEKTLRQAIVDKSLTALQAQIQKQTQFD